MTESRERVEKLKAMARNPDFIPGIYNYCDRWCERCPMTARCMNYAMAEERFSDAPSRDMENELFWQKLSETFADALTLLKEAAQAHGIDLRDVEDDDFDPGAQKAHPAAEDHPCCQLAREYAQMVDRWNESVREDLPSRRERAASQEIEMAASSSAPDPISDAWAVIGWYQHQIYVKLMRAATGLAEEIDDIEDSFASDADGSAKVALIAMDRSIAAWGKLIPVHFQRASEIQEILVSLERLRRNTEAAFPRARDFLRPGFDTIPRND